MVDMVDRKKMSKIPKNRQPGYSLTTDGQGVHNISAYFQYFAMYYVVVQVK